MHALLKFNTIVVAGQQITVIQVRIICQLQHPGENLRLGFIEMDHRYRAVRNIHACGDHGVWNVKHTADEG